MGRDERDEAWSPAQVCTNGHVLTCMVDELPHYTADHCKTCGVETITKCPGCGAIIRGYAHGGGVFVRYSPPAYCHSCGKPYPWTEAKIRAAKELAQLVQGSPEEKRLLEASIEDLVRDTPAATVAAVRFKSIVGKAGKAVADGFRDILVDVLSESVKKILWPDAPPSRR